MWPLLSVSFDVIKLCKKEQVENPVMTFFTFKYKDLKIMYCTLGINLRKQPRILMLSSV